MREHQTDQDRFLLPSRCIGRRNAFRPIGDVEIGQMRAVERAACGGVAWPAIAQHVAIALLDFGCGFCEQRILHPAVQL